MASSDLVNLSWFGCSNRGMAAHHICRSKWFRLNVCEASPVEVHMRRFFIPPLSSILVAALLPVITRADSGVTVSSTTQYLTPEKSVSVVRDVYLRDGQTNLVRETRSRDGQLLVRTQEFCQGNTRIGICFTSPDGTTFQTESGSDLTLAFGFLKRKDTDFVCIRNKNGLIIDAFSCTNGIYYPAAKEWIQILNASWSSAVRSATKPDSDTGVGASGRRE